MALVRPATRAGVAAVAAVVVPFPSSPELLAPQHSTAPPVITAQAWVMVMATVVAPVTPVATDGAPAPTLPFQQLTSLLDEITHVLAPPVAIETASVTPVAGTGRKAEPFWLL